MGVSLKKPTPQIVRDQAVLPAYPAFDVAPLVIDVTYANRGRLMINYIQHDAGSNALMLVQYKNEVDKTLYPMTLIDGTITVAAGVGFENDIDDWIISMPLRTTTCSFALDCADIKQVVITFCEANQVGASEGELSCYIGLRLGV